jgi:nucleotide-binding universal stress UspA family protein
MTIKSILCIFGGSQDELNALNTAFLLGHAYSAQIRVLHVSSDPVAYSGIYGEGIIASAAIVEAIEKENKQRLDKAKEYVASFAAKHHIPLDAPHPPAHHASARFIHHVGMIDSTIGQEGRLSDLIVIGREHNPAHDLITPALFNTGRPVLLLPVAQDGLSKEWQDKTVAFAWNGSLQAARAIYNAIPLLGRTEKLYLLTAEGHGHKHDLAAEAAVMEYLRAHGINTQAILVGGGNYHADGEALLMRAKDLRADLLVMGAYGHSMFREMVLGGVTEHMITKSDIPLLLSH